MQRKVVRSRAARVYLRLNILQQLVLFCFHHKCECAKLCSVLEAICKVAMGNF